MPTNYAETQLELANDIFQKNSNIKYFMGRLICYLSFLLEEQAKGNWLNAKSPDTNRDSSKTFVLWFIL